MPAVDGFPRIASGTTDSKRSFSDADPKPITAHRSPARLNALLADVSVIVRDATSCPSEAKAT